MLRVSGGSEGAFCHPSPHRRVVICIFSVVMRASSDVQGDGAAADDAYYDHLDGDMVVFCE